MGNRIKEWREKRNLSLQQLADLVETTNQTVSRHELGQRKLSEDWLFKYSAALQTNIESLMGKSITGVTEPVVDVPVISWVNAGHLLAVEEPDLRGWAEGSVPVKTRKRGLFALRVEGSSMNRVAGPGSHIVVDPSDRGLSDGKYYVVRVRGDATFKRYRAKPDRLEPDSTDADHQTIYPEDGMEVIGRVIKVERDL